MRKQCGRGGLLERGALEKGRDVGRERLSQIGTRKPETIEIRTVC